MNKKFDEKNGLLEIRTYQHIPKNGIIYDSLGKLPNQQLLLIYGICLENNPHEVFQIGFDIEDDDPLHEAKRLLLEKRNISYGPIYVS